MLILHQGGWREPPPGLTLGPHAVHVWRVDLAVDDDRVEALHGVLSRRERERAGRLLTQVHRRRFVVARGVLRSVLASYLGRRAEEVPIDYGAREKPRLGPLRDAPDLRFNVSHSEDLALIALTLGREVGVDLERIRELADSTRVAERNFTRSEFEQIRSLRGADRSRAFFACWTRKEAYVKARGDGLSYPLDVFEVSVRPQPALLIWNSREPGDVLRWSMENVDAGRGYAAAVVVERAGSRSNRAIEVAALPADLDGFWPRARAA